MPVKVKRRQIAEIGWREMVDLPSLGITGIKAKIDTGARTTAIQASKIEIIDRDGKKWAKFTVDHPEHPSGIACEAELTDERAIRNTGGDAEDRWIVKSNLKLGENIWPIEISLADRKSMKFPLIIGRTAIRGRNILVNPGQSFLAGRSVQARRVVETAETEK